MLERVISEAVVTDFDFLFSSPSIQFSILNPIRMIGVLGAYKGVIEKVRATVPKLPFFSNFSPNAQLFFVRSAHDTSLARYKRSVADHSC